MFRNSMETISQRDASPVPIISDAAMATAQLGNGRLIPLIIFSKAAREDLAELVRVHDHFPPGDVTIQWGRVPPSSPDISLLLRFLRPVMTTACFTFNLSNQFALIDQILRSGAVYLQPGNPGDRLKTTMSVPRVLVEIPDTGFQESWQRLLIKTVRARLRGDGLSRRAANEAAKEVVAQLRKLDDIRVQK
jgi:hypothetical protein